MSHEPDLDAARTALTEERDKLLHQLEELGATEDGELRSDVDLGEGFADAASITADRTNRLGIVESLKETLDSVVLALGKVDEGTYGHCINCDKEIGAERMEARPNSLYCVDCKTLL